VRLMKTSHLMRIIVAPVLGGLALLCASAAELSAQAFNPGEILVLDPISTARVFNGATESFVNVSNGVQRYTQGGSLEQSYLGEQGDQMSGLTVVADGRLVISYTGTGSVAPPPIGFIAARTRVFNADGTRFSDFALPSVAKTGLTTTVGDVSAFADGTLAIVDPLNATVVFYTETGVFIRSANLPGVTTPTGSDVGPDGVLYVTGGSGQRGTLSRLAQDGTLLGSPVALNFLPGDVAVSHADGTLWVADAGNGSVEHLRNDGTVLGSFQSGFTDATGRRSGFNGISVSPDGVTIYAASRNFIRKFDASGHALGDIVVTTSSNSTTLFVAQNQGTTPTPTPVPTPTPTPVPTATPVPSDGVAITQAEYSLNNGQLRVQATSTNRSSTLTTSVTSTGKVIGVLTGSGPGQYKGQFTVTPNPVNITVKSSGGGSASIPVVAK
jgi:hypothetical protein